MPLATAGLASKTVIAATWLLTWRLVTRSLGLLSTVLLARLLTPADFGLVAIATALGAAVDSLSQLGLQDALVRRVGEGRHLFDTAFTLQLGRAVVTTCVVAGIAPFAAEWFAEPRLEWILVVLAGCTLVGGFENIAIVEYRRAMRFSVQFKLLSLPRLVQVACTVTAAVLLQSYWALMIGIGVSRMLRTMLTYWVHPYRPRLRLAGWQELWGFSVWTWAASTVAVMWDRAETFVLGPWLGTANFGLYLISLEMATLPTSELVDPTADALFAGFAAAQTQGQPSTQHAPLVAATLMMAVTPLAIIISAEASDIVAVLLGPKWTQAAPLISILAWLTLFSPMSYVCNVVLIANNFVRRAFCVRVVAACIKLAAMFAALSLTQRLDVIAGLITAAVVLESSVYMIALKGTGGIQLRTMVGPVLRILVSGVLILGALWGCGLAWQTDSLSTGLALARGSAIGVTVVVAYGALVWAMWLACGKPDGPEARLLALAAGSIGSVVAVARRLRRVARVQSSAGAP